MKTLLFAILIAAFSYGCQQGKSEKTEEKVDMTVNEEIPQIKLASFNSEAGKYVDQEIKVKGIVDHVCMHSGKKLRLVGEDAESIHVEAETRFDDALVGNQIQLTGIVKEERIDESSCLQMEEDNIKNHKEGSMNEEQLSHQKQQIKHYRDSMAVAGVDHLSFYTLEFVALEKETEKDTE